MNIKNPETKYRPIPFWSWNENLNKEETKRQINMMHEAGIGGYFMHARGGLQTEYMEDEWFENISVGTSEGAKLGMYAWAYDENGWPSGFGSGKINGKGTEYQQKYLRMDVGEKSTEYTIANIDGYHFYYDVNPFYVDLLDENVVKAFIEEIYAPYYEKLKNDIVGFFTDEPQLSRNGIPWSFVLESEYKKEYGEELLNVLPDLFMETKTYKKTRVQFWRLITKLFSVSFGKQIYDWCEERKLQFTGHMVLEESMLEQLTANGAVMPNYEYFHIPGMDCLGREFISKLTSLQVSSVANQLGKKQVLSETFALTGWNVSFEELKSLYEHQMVRGINLLCTHLAGYSLRGIRKRDFPPSLFYQQPWWNKYNLFVDAMSRIGMLLSEGRIEYDTLLVHPQTTAWVLFDDGKNEGIEDFNTKLMQTIDELEEKHILFHLGDELIMEKYAKVEGNELILGTQRYKTVVLPPHIIFWESTNNLLEEFKQNGGNVITVDMVLPNDIIDNKNIVYTKRIFDDFDLYYFVNSTSANQTVNIKCGTTMLDILTGIEKSFQNNTVIPAGGSLVVFDYTKKIPEEISKEKDIIVIPKGKWCVKNSDFNALTLDYCKYSFDGKIIENHGPVISIQEKACMLERKTRVSQQYTFNAEYVPDEIYLVCETPEIFDIKINGQVLKKDVCGTYFDQSFKRMNLKGYLNIGENEILMECNFEQSPEIYENLRKSRVFESEKNKFAYDMELESIYLVGNFALKTDEKFEKLKRNAVRYKGEFTVCAPKRELYLENIEQQGYPFFAGSITLEKIFIANNIDKCLLELKEKYANIVSININGNNAGDIIWKPYVMDLSPYIKSGENKLEITLVNSLRNLLGPHHLESGESYNVTPASFFKEDTVWGTWAKEEWNDGYCFVEFGIELDKKR